MCGRYALVLRPSVLRQRLRDYGLPVAEPDPPVNSQHQHKTDAYRHTDFTDRSEAQGTQQVAENTNGDSEGTRQSYNIAPGYIEPVYRAIPDSQSNVFSDGAKNEIGSDVKYIVQGMKWGLVPSWTQQNPDYRTIMKSINCRDDSLQNNSSMWTSMKKKKRCIVLAEGFFEWRKQGNNKIPYYIKRQDGHLMCMAGLWDCVTLPDITTSEPSMLYTYTVITVSANSQMQFLHDRMPAFLTTPEEILTWLDLTTTVWTPELQNLLRPFSGTLEIYPVPREVGKVGNNDKTFVLPLDSQENKANIKNWFGTKGSFNAGGLKRKSNDVSVDNGEGDTEEPAGDSKARLKRELGENMESHPPKSLKFGIQDDQKESNVSNGSELEISPKGYQIAPPDPSIKKFEKKSHTADGKNHGPTTRRDQTSPRQKIASTPKKGNKSRKIVSTNGNMKITNFFPK